MPAHARIKKIFSGVGVGGGGVQILRRGLTENFNIAKINDLAIPSGGGGVRTPCPPSGSAHTCICNTFKEQHMKLNSFCVLVPDHLLALIAHYFFKIVHSA